MSGVKQHVVKALQELKVPEKPKRPLTPYFKFVQERRESIIKQYPDWKVTQVSVQCAADWKALDKSTKSKYEERYKTDIEQYAKKYSEYMNSLTPEQKEALENYKHEVKQAKVRRERKKKIRETGKPKRPVGAYMLYVMEQAKLPSNANKSYVTLLGQLKDTWAEMPEGEKAKYLQETAKAKQQYEEDLKNWELKMMEEGNLDVVRNSTLTGKSPKPRKSK